MRTLVVARWLHDCGLGRIGLFSETYNHLRLDHAGRRGVLGVGPRRYASRLARGRAAALASPCAVRLRRPGRGILY